MCEVLYKTIKNTTNKILKTKIGKELYYLLRKLMLWEIISRYFEVKKLKIIASTPSYLSDSQSFFQQNIERIEKINSWLSDDLSKNIFNGLIKFRYTYNFNEFPYKDKCKLKQQYFYNNFFHYNDEIYIDCGAYDGDTINNFKKAMKRYKAKYVKIIAFEPNLDYCAMIIKKRVNKLCVINSGVWHEDTFLDFNGNGSTMKISEDREAKKLIQVKAIDNCIECENTTFIKMDIEGAELPALIGAKNTILKNKPKLAICIYHSNEDMLRIAEWIKETVPEYKLYIRHHRKLSPHETVLYATL